MHCLSMCHKKDARLIWVNVFYKTLSRKGSKFFEPADQFDGVRCLDKIIAVLVARVKLVTADEHTGLRLVSIRV